jgi:hypothetical protein
MTGCHVIPLDPVRLSLAPALALTNPPIQWIKGLFPRIQSVRVVNLVTRLKLFPMSKSRGCKHPLPIRLQGVELNCELSTGKDLSFFSPGASMRFQCWAEWLKLQCTV